MTSYFDLKKKAKSGTGGSSYFALKKQVSPVLAQLRKKRELEDKLKQESQSKKEVQKSYKESFKNRDTLKYEKSFGEVPAGEIKKPSFFTRLKNKLTDHLKKLPVTRAIKEKNPKILTQYLQLNEKQKSAKNEIKRLSQLKNNASNEDKKKIDREMSRLAFETLPVDESTGGISKQGAKFTAKFLNKSVSKLDSKITKLERKIQTTKNIEQKLAHQEELVKLKSDRLKFSKELKKAPCRHCLDEANKHTDEAPVQKGIFVKGAKNQAEAEKVALQMYGTSNTERIGKNTHAWNEKDGKVFDYHQANGEVEKPFQYVSEKRILNLKKSLQKQSSTKTPHSQLVSQKQSGQQVSYNKVNTNTTKLSQRQKVVNLIKKQGEKITDRTIRKTREKNLLGEETIDEIIARKRGVITDKQAIERAKNIKMTIDDVVNLPKGTTPSKEQMTAISQVVQGERELNKGLKQILNGGGVSQGKAERKLIKNLGDKFDNLSEEELVTRALEESTLKLKKAEMALFAVKSEAGRSLQSTKQLVQGIDSRMRVLFGRMKKKTPLEKQAILEEIARRPIDNDKNFLKMLDKLSDADAFDKVAEWATAAKLWNATTHIVNFGGNTLRQIADFAITNITNPKTARADVAGAINGLKQGLRNSIRALTDEGYARQLSKYIEEGGQAPAIKGKLGTVVRTPFRALGAGDEIFRAIGYQRSLYRQAQKLSKSSAEMKKLLKAPTFKMMKEATEQGKRLTFQEDMGEIASAINRARTPANSQSKLGKSGSLLLRLTLPFLKTPNNLLKQAIDFSPFGFLKNGKSIVQGLKAGGAKAEHAKRLIGEAVVGTGLTAYVAHEFTQGNVTGAAPRDKKAKDQFYREGKLPYAIKMGDSWYQYKRVDPFSTVLGTVADMMELAKQDDIDFSSVVHKVIDQVSDKTYLKGMSDLMKFLTGEPWEREMVAKNILVGSALPSFLGHTARTVDPQIRESKSLMSSIKSQIPGLSKKLPAKYNVLGEPLTRANKGADYFVNPIQHINKKPDEVTKQFKELNWIPPLAPKSFTEDGQKHSLDEKQYSEFSKSMGENLKKNYSELIKSEGYQRASSDEKVDMLSSMRSDILKLEKAKFLKQDTSKMESDLKMELKYQNIAEANDSEAQKMINDMSDEEYKAYQNKSASEKRKMMIKTRDLLKSNPSEAVKYVQSLRDWEGDYIINTLTDEEYDLYNNAKQ
jgi:hypothetical protein